MYQLITRCTADLYYAECENEEFKAGFGHSDAFLQKTTCQIKLEIDSIYRYQLTYIYLAFVFISVTTFLFVYFDKETKEGYDQKVLILSFFFPFISPYFLKWNSNFLLSSHFMSSDSRIDAIHFYVWQIL